MSTTCSTWHLSWPNERQVTCPLSACFLSLPYPSLSPFPSPLIPFSPFPPSAAFMAPPSQTNSSAYIPCLVFHIFSPSLSLLTTRPPLPSPPWLLSSPQLVHHLLFCPQATFQAVSAPSAALLHHLALALLSRLLPGSEHLAHELLLSCVFRPEFLP